MFKVQPTAFQAGTVKFQCSRNETAITSNYLGQIKSNGGRSVENYKIVIRKVAICISLA